ncbi:unnamed protein product [Ilex paraguariensis]|uniref:Auxin-responsive protein n=1 Tax=Ilex paraguariensis TaxID=185542 RepID=A0ABC8RHX3_9AQUA
MRFNMRFEGEDSPERRFTGTIVGVGDISSQWKDSTWRSLKVQWDEPASIARPDRVSPWEIESFAASGPTSLVQPVPVKNKRPRPPIEIPVLDTASSAVWHSSHDSMSSAVWHPSHDSTKLSGTADRQRTENHIPTPMTCSHNGILRMHVEGGWTSSSHVTASRKMNIDETEESRSASAWSVPSHHSTLHSMKQSNELMPDLVDGRSGTVASFRLFGIDLKSPAIGALLAEKAPLKLVSVSNVAAEGNLLSAVSAVVSDQNSELSKDSKEQKLEQLQVSPKEVQSKQSCSTRSRTKVQMQGVAVGRAVDLTALKGYDDLISELENMFGIKGELCPRSKWEIVFTDDEGDMMLMGDDPWPEFCNMVRRILICSSQDVKKMSAESKLPLFIVDSEGTTTSLDAVQN